jgi:uncharacterized protein YegL
MDEKAINLESNETVAEFRIIFLIDCSESMKNNERMDFVKQLIQNQIRHIQSIQNNSRINTSIRILQFSTNAQWMTDDFIPIEKFDWSDIQFEYGQVTDLGDALHLLAEALKLQKDGGTMPERGIPPYLVLICDGYPTDDWETSLNLLMNEFWGAHSVRIGIGIGEADREILGRFVGNVPDFEKKLIMNPKCEKQNNEFLESIKFCSSILYDQPKKKKENIPISLNGISSDQEPPTLVAGHTKRVNAVAETPDGKRAVSGSYDRTLKVWDLESGRGTLNHDELQRPVSEKLEKTDEKKLLGNVCIQTGSSKQTTITEKLHENAQFTVYRPSAIMPEKWYSLLFFAHLAERPDNAKEDEPDPLEEVERQAGEILQDTLEQYSQLRQDSSHSLPKEGQLTIKLDIEGIVCNPSERIFSWYEPVHREIFRIKTTRDYINRICRGRISVYFGSICVAEIQCPIKVTDSPTINKTTFNRTSTRRYRKIFTSYSRKDEKVVIACENYARATGDEFLRDVVSIHNGEIWNKRLLDLIREADIFQLFWSNKSMHSPFVQQEWGYALTLNRPDFIRPVYWEDPFPEDTEKKLPPQELQQFQFHKLGDIFMHYSDRQDTEVQVNRDRVSLSSHNNSVEARAATPDDKYSVSGLAEENPKVLDLETLKNASMKCPNCNYVSPRNSKFCKRCGYTFISSPPPQSLSQTPVQAITSNSCSACGEVNQPTSTFCRNCGSPMKKPIPSSLPPSYPVTSDIQISGSAKDLLSQIEVASPEQPHCVILLLLDTSGSMIENRKIDQLNEGIRLIKEEILRDESASSLVDIAVVTFGDGVVNVVHPFTSIRDFQPPFLSANGDTPLGDAILKGIDLIETRKKIYRDQGVNFFRPWIFMITDGEPTDMKNGDQKWANVKRLIEDGEKNGKFMFFTVGIEPANMNLLNGLMPPSRGAIKLRQDKFRDMFLWLSKSQEKIVRSDLSPGETVKLESPDGWGELFVKKKDLVFISAKSEDDVSANRVYSYLTEHGYPVFFSDQTLPRKGNCDYRREIDRALDLAKHMIVVTSRKEYVESKWVEVEWGSFINEKRSGRKQGNIITLIVGSMKISDLPTSLRNYEVLPFDPTTFDKILPCLE